MHIYTLILIHLSLSNWAMWHTVIYNELADRYFHVDCRLLVVGHISVFGIVCIKT